MFTRFLFMKRNTLSRSQLHHDTWINKMLSKYPQQVIHRTCHTCFTKLQDVKMPIIYNKMVDIDQKILVE